MPVAIITGSSGLIGSESVRVFHNMGLDIVGIDNDMRSYFFGSEASTRPVAAKLERELPRFRTEAIDIRDQAAIDRIFSRLGNDIALVVHTAAQPSHDWAAREPLTDFGVNATGTFHLLEATRQHCPEAVFLFTSTNKVYGDHPNRLPLIERETRLELNDSHPYALYGINESMSIDQCEHSLYGASKLAADLSVQEYAHHFGMNTGVFRCGCITGPDHAGAELHGFLAYLLKCTATGRPYRIYGFQGKQVRDNLHVADLVDALALYFQHPRPGAVYNIGGGRTNSCSILEAIRLCETATRRKLETSFAPTPRAGDHRWWITDTRKFQTDYPAWTPSRQLTDIIRELAEEQAQCRTHSGYAKILR